MIANQLMRQAGRRRRMDIKNNNNNNRLKAFQFSFFLPLLVLLSLVFFSILFSEHRWFVCKALFNFMTPPHHHLCIPI